MADDSLTEGVGASPMPQATTPGGFTMEHGKHSQPIGSLNPFTENVSPSERASSADWKQDANNGDSGSGFGSGTPGGGEDGNGDLAGVERLDAPTYGPTDQKPYEV